jgi:hypothetical protein
MRCKVTEYPTFWSLSRLNYCNWSIRVTWRGNHFVSEFRPSKKLYRFVESFSARLEACWRLRWTRQRLAAHQHFLKFSSIIVLHLFPSEPRISALLHHRAFQRSSISAPPATRKFGCWWILITISMHPPRNVQQWLVESTAMSFNLHNSFCWVRSWWFLCLHPSLHSHSQTIHCVFGILRFIFLWHSRDTLSKAHQALLSRSPACSRVFQLLTSWLRSSSWTST